MMTSFSDNAAVSFLRRDGEVLYYAGGFHTELSSGTIPYGGCLNAIIANACLHAVQDTTLNEIIHMTIYYYKGCLFGPCEIEVRILRQSKTFQNVQVNIIQQGIQQTTAHLLVGKLPEAPLGAGQQRPLTLTPASPLYRYSPVSIHPSTSQTATYPPAWKFALSLRVSHDPVYEQRNIAKAASATTTTVDMNGILEDGRLVQLAHPNDMLNQVTIAAISDHVRSMNMLVPKSELPKIGAREFQGWATMVATIDFKHRLPRSPSFSNNIIDMYTNTRFATDGRGEVMSELWSAPPGVVGDSFRAIEEGWREKMICLAVTTQMAVVLRDFSLSLLVSDRTDGSRL